jgi:hypothetical protein
MRIALLAAVSAVATPLGAADRPKLFAPPEVGGFVELRSEIERERRERDGVVFLDGDRLEFQQILHLDVDGFVYHPRFVDYDVGTEFALVRDGNGGDFASGGSRVLGGGDFRVTFLRDHPYSLSLYGMSGEDEVERLFAPPLDISRRAYGASLAFQKGWLPFWLSYDHTSWEQEEDSSQFESGREEVLDAFRALSRYRVGRSSGELSYRLQYRESRLAPDIQEQLVRATNYTDLDAGGRKTFTGSFQWTDRTGRGELVPGAAPQDRESLSARGLVTLRHSDRFSTEYDAEFHGIETNGARLSHQLYGSLFTTGEVRARVEDASFGNIRTYEARLREEYRKRIGNGRYLQITLAPLLSLTQTEPGSDAGLQIGESHVLVDALPITLNRRYPDPATVVVTDQSGLVVYVEGLDYAVSALGSLVEVVRIPTGSIADGEAVLVDYEYRLGGEGDVLSTDLRVGTKLSFMDWRPFDFVQLYWDFVSQEDKKLSGDVDQTLESRRQMLAGAEASWEWGSAEMEYESDTSDLRAFWSLSQSVTLKAPPSWSWTANLRGTHRRIVYEYPDTAVSYLTLIASARRRLPWRGQLEIQLEWQKSAWEDSGLSQANDSSGFALEASLRFWYRALEFELVGRWSGIEYTEQIERVDSLLLRVRRPF